MNQRNPFDLALADEGILGTPLEPLVRSIYGQESNSGKNTATSYAGAVGPMQILPPTFNSVADKGWSINDPYHNARAGIRYAKQGWEASGGDPRLTAAYYYGGPGGMNKLANGVAVPDPRNPNAPTTAQYASQVVNRMSGYNNPPGKIMPPITTDASVDPVLTIPTRGGNSGAGILDKIGNTPGLSEALIGMGAGLLSGGTLGQGLSKGFVGFNNGFDQGLENHKARVTPIANGAFMQVVDKDGTIRVVPNPAAQDFIMKSKEADLNKQLTLLGYKLDNQPKTAAEQKLDDERKDAVYSFKDTKADVEDVLKFGDKVKPGVGTQLAGTGLGKTITNLTSGVSSDAADAAQFQTKLSNVLTSKWLDIGQKLKGAQSDAEGRQLLSTLPSPTADYETVIKPWLQKYKTWLENAEIRAQEKLDPSNRDNPNKTNTGTKVPPVGKVEVQALPPVQNAPAAPAAPEDNDPFGIRKKK